MTIETDAGLVERARDAARRAERLCLISAALDSPVHVRVDVDAKPREPALPA